MDGVVGGREGGESMDGVVGRGKDGWRGRGEDGVVGGRKGEQKRGCWWLF